MATVENDLLEAIQANLETVQESVAEMIEDMKSLKRVLTALIGQISADDNAGGLLSRETMRMADQARLFLSKMHVPPPEG